MSTAERRCSCCSHAESVHTPRGCVGGRGGAVRSGDCLCPAFTPRLAREVIASIRAKQVERLTAENAILKVAARALLDALPRCESDRLETFGTHLPVHTPPVPATREAFDYRRSAYVCDACAEEIEQMDRAFKSDAGLRLPWADEAEALRKAVEG